MVRQSYKQVTNHAHQIENVNTRLEKAKKIAKNKKVFPVYNKEDHFVVRTDDGKGFYIVSPEGCCDKDQQRRDLLQGYCEHRLAVELFKEAQDAASWALPFDDEASDEASFEPEEEPERHLSHQASGRRTVWTS